MVDREEAVRNLTTHAADLRMGFVDDPVGAAFAIGDLIDAYDFGALEPELEDAWTVAHAGRFDEAAERLEGVASDLS
jgi:hypothetical protein